MSKDLTPSSRPGAGASEPAATVTISVEKSDIASLFSTQSEIGLDGEFLWPIPVRNLSNLYRASAEHGRAIHLKAEGAFGGGLMGEQAELIEDLCDTGATELCILLDLDLGTFGNAFLQIIWSKDGERIIGLRRLPAITMSRVKGGFVQRTPAANGQTKKVTFTAEEVLHLRVPCPMGGHYALPTWIGAEGMLELALAATRYNASFFKNNAMPEYAIIFKGATPSAEQKKDIQEFFRNEHRGIENAHRTLVMTTPEDGEIEIERLTAEVKDGDFLKLIDAARDRLPVAHGTPPRVMGIMSAGQLGGGGEVTGQLFTFEHLTLRPSRRRMLDQLRPVLKHLGLRPGNPDEPLSKDQVAFRQLDLTPPSDDADDLPGLVSTGILSPEEARALVPALANSNQNRAEAPGAPVERSAPNGSMDALVALLARS